MTAQLAAHEELFFRGNEHMSAGALAAAEECYRRALALAPQFAAAHANLGFVLDQRGDYAAAEACYRRALAVDSCNADVQRNLGSVLLSQKRLDDAELAYARSLILRPEAPASWSNLGVAYACAKREREAEHCYRVALSLDPQHVLAQFNLSYVLLRQGRMEEGWQRFEARDWYSTLAAHFSCPRWQGEALAGKSLLITPDAGHGDMIQFARYLQLLAARGVAHITLLCHPALKRLFATLHGVERVIGLDENVPREGWDAWTPVLSLPYHCQTRLESIPAELPYLRAEPAKIAAWAARLPSDQLKVGLAWRGNPRFENDADRSLPSLHTLAPLAAVSGVSFVSLQKGAGEEEAREHGADWSLIDAAPAIEDFSDTAALIANLDLVISVDSAPAHLAGALGIACWTLLPDYKTDWRWLTERSDSPWYPNTMRLFRQQTPGDWTSTIATLSAALQALARPDTASVRSMA
jgi:Tfp pilus assembly protein PilF